MRGHSEAISPIVAQLAMANLRSLHRVPQFRNLIPYAGDFVLQLLLIRDDLCAYLTQLVCHEPLCQRHLGC